MNFKVEKKANNVYIVADCGTIFKVWHESEFTKRKLNNAIKKISANTTETAFFEICL